jgi:ABC-type branched-subunit amino acid transport system substrate-binding protein
MYRIARQGLATVAALILMTSAAACGGDDGGSTPRADVPGVTDTEVVIGTHQPLTGPAAPGYSKIAKAGQAYFNYVNANGGVHGRKITYKIMDDGYNPANTQQVVRELVLQDKVFAILNGLGTPTHTGVLDFLKSQRVPDLFVASGSTSWDQPDKYPQTFGFQPDYIVEGKILATYIKAEFAGQKICHLGQNDDFGRDHLAGVEKILGADGLAAKEQYVPTNTNIAPQIGAFKAAGCQVVVLGTVPGFTALTLGTAARLAYRPQWVVSSVGGDYLTLAGRLGAEGTPLLEGLITAGYLPPVADKSNPWIQLYEKVNKEYNGGVEFDGNVLYGMSVAYTFVTALQSAGKDLTRESIVEAIEKGGFKGPGLTPFRYAKGDHSGYSGLQMGRTASGVQTPFGPVYVTDEGDGEVTEFTEAPAAPPENGIPS